MRGAFPIMVTIATAVGCAAPPALPPSAPSTLVGNAVPDFRRVALDGSTFDTKSARGHVVVVKFFAKYCAPCKKTLPEAERLHRERPEITMVGIDEDEQESDAREVVASFGLTFPVVHDSGNVLSGRFRVRDLPMTFVVDASGGVRWVAASEDAHAALGSAVDAAK